MGKAMYVWGILLSACEYRTYECADYNSCVVKCLQRPRADSYSPIPKLSIWVAACSANFRTLPE
jgi:hypothetical protein